MMMITGMLLESNVLILMTTMIPQTALTKYDLTEQQQSQSRRLNQASGKVFCIDVTTAFSSCYSFLNLLCMLAA